jgi:hypothetical protein
MSTAHDQSSAAVDPDNRLLWRMNRRRLHAEEIRDSLLATSGRLDRAMGGSLLEGANRSYVKGYPNASYEQYEHPRRSIYLPVLRSMLYDVFQAFDFPDPSTPNGQRASTTVAPQGLFMLNSKLTRDQARSLAEALVNRQDLDDAGRAKLAYIRILGRDPADFEVSRATSFVRAYAARAPSGTASAQAGDPALRSWQAFCQALVASNEFLFVE